MSDHVASGSVMSNCAAPTIRSLIVFPSATGDDADKVMRMAKTLSFEGRRLEIRYALPRGAIFNSIHAASQQIGRELMQKRAGGPQLRILMLLMRARRRMAAQRERSGVTTRKRSAN